MLVHHMILVSFRLFRKNLSNLREFLGKCFTAPLAKKCPYDFDTVCFAVRHGLRLHAFYVLTVTCSTTKFDLSKNAKAGESGCQLNRTSALYSFILPELGLAHSYKIIVSTREEKMR